MSDISKIDTNFASKRQKFLHKSVGNQIGVKATVIQNAQKVSIRESKNRGYA